MTETPNTEPNSSASNDSRLNRSGRLFLKSLWKSIQNILSLKEGVDKEATSEGIRADVEFKGHAAWILVFSIFIASIGLNTGSVAVIIGAMLISPLMGPILGIGLAAGTNDVDLLTKSLKNFGVMVIISVIISTLYFFIVPTPEINLELKGRKEATLLAIAVAFFGGAAGIIAGSRSLKSNAVPGVAIATALMPPLCTVGFGLATGQWDYFFGALYLFFINSVFIALPTYLYIKYMRFPVKEFVEPKRELKVKRLIYSFVALIMIPSFFIFYNVLQQSFFATNAEAFLAKIENSLDNTGTSIIDRKVVYNKDHAQITIALMGDPVGDETEALWNSMLSDFGLERAQLNIRRPKDYSQEIQDLKNLTSEQSLAQSRMMYQGLIDQRNSEIDSLKQRLAIKERARIDSRKLLQEIHLLTVDVEQAAFAQVIQVREGGLDTVPTFLVQWRSGTSSSKRAEDKDLLERWFQSSMKRPKVEVLDHRFE